MGIPIFSIIWEDREMVGLRRKHPNPTIFSAPFSLNQNNPLIQNLFYFSLSAPQITPNKHTHKIQIPLPIVTKKKTATCIIIGGRQKELPAKWLEFCEIQILVGV